MSPGRSRLSSAIECVFHSSRISPYSSTSTGRRRSSRIRSEAIASVHITGEQAPPALRDEKPLARNDRRAREPVRLLQLPYARTRVPPVARRSDRPQRLACTHPVVLRSAARAGIPREHRPQKNCGENDDDDSTEHVFALWHEHLFVSSGTYGRSTVLRTTSVLRERLDSAANW